MRHEQMPFGHVLAVEPGEESIRSPIAFARQQEVEAGSAHGLGCVGSVELGFYRPAEEMYARTHIDEPLEVLELEANP
jgi:predicted DNA-binding protein with PD1-like motif